MALWNPRKPLSQPPGYGRVAARDSIKRDDAAAAAKLAHSGAQFDRLDHTKKYGLRAVVR